MTRNVADCGPAVPWILFSRRQPVNADRAELQRLEPFAPMQPLLRNLDQLFDREFDVLVVGAGIAGACAAWDAAMRGMSVALIDAADFASGASSNSLKLLHGGLRYVKRILPREAREAVRERRTWLRIAPHLVEPLPILVPAYDRSMQNPLFVRLLLTASDTVAWDRNHGLSEERRIARSRMLTRSEVLALVPALAETRPAGGALFHDAQIRNTERLVLEIVRAAASAGAVVANHVAFDSSILRHGAVVGARLTDRITGAKGELRTRAIILAVGGDVPAAIERVLPDVPVRTHRYSLAMNVMMRATGLPVAVTLPSRMSDARQSRQLLWVPWRDREILGTYHRHLVEPSSHPRIEEEDVVAFLDEVNRVIPSLHLEREDILLVHAGTLPLAEASRRADLQLLRRHRIIDHTAHGASGAVSLISVKYTTGRLAAEEAVNLAQERVGREVSPSVTSITPLPSAPDNVSALRHEAVQKHGQLLPEDIIDHLVGTYGTRYTQVLAHRETTAHWNQRVHTSSPVIYAELVHGVRDEMAQTADDLLRRRTELGARGVSDNAVLARIADVLGHELGRRA